MNRRLYYHASCPDGFGAAWAVWRVWGERGRYVPRGHDDRVEPSAVEGELVVFADIAPANDELRALGEVAAQVVVLDHHVTARDRFAAEPDLENALAPAGHQVHFDLGHSGAVLAWNYFHRGEPPPELLRYVQDQDLWAWELPASEAVNAAIGSYPMEFEVWDELARRTSQSLAHEGEPIARANRLEIGRVARGAHPVFLDGAPIEAVNAQRLRSQIGHEIAKRAAFGRPWGATYRVAGTRVDVSLYSIGDLDVARVAERYGGGGHRNAAGFSVTLATWLAFVDSTPPE